MVATSLTGSAPDPDTRIAQLEARIAALEGRRSAPAATAPAATELTDASEAEAEPRTRRQLLRLAGAAVVGTAAAAVAGSATAAADDTFSVFNVSNGADFNTNDFTRINYTGTAVDGAAFLFQGGVGYNNAGSGEPAVLAGWATGSENLLSVGVYGYTDFASGYGVIGSGFAKGMLAKGSLFGLEAQASSEDGAAVHATNVGGPGVLAEGTRIGVSGTATSPSTGTIGVYGNAPGAGVQGEGSTGVAGLGTAIGVLGTGPIGVVGTGDSIGLRASAISTNGTALDLPALSGRTAPGSRAAAYTVGRIEMDENGNLWMCTVAGTPGTWRKLTGPAVAGAFHPLTPGRVVDTRLSAGGIGPLTSGSALTVSVADRKAVGVVPALADFVPAGATAIAANVTVTNTVASGFLTVNPGGNSTIGASTINWSTSGLSLANGVILTLNASRELTIVYGGGATAATNVIVDVNGYYL